MPYPIHYRPSESSYQMLDEMITYYNQDTPAILSRAIAELYRIYQRESAGVSVPQPPVPVPDGQGEAPP